MKIDVSQSVPNLRAAVRAALLRLNLGGAGQNRATENRVHATASNRISHGTASATTSPSLSLRDTKPSSAASDPP